MPSPLSEHLKAARTAAGLRPGELALKAGWRSAETGGSWIARFERDGDAIASDAEIARLAAALGVDPAAIERLESEERKRARAEWNAWADEPVPVSFCVRMMPAVWHSIEIPGGMSDRDEVLGWVRSQAKWASLVRCVTWSRRHSTYFREDGTTYEAHAGFGDPGPGPRMTLG